MKKIEIFKLPDNSLCVEIYANINFVNPAMVLNGEEAVNAIFGLKKDKILAIREIQKSDEMILVYEKGIIILNEYTEIMYKKGMRVLRDNIKKFKENESLKNNKNKKIVRKNKHVGKVIVPMSLVAVMALSGTLIGYEDTNSLGYDKNYYNIHPLKYMQIIGETIPTEQASDNYLEELAKQIAQNPNKDSVTYHSDVLETEEETNLIFIEYEDRSKTDKAYFAKNNYWDFIVKYSEMYGLDPNLVLAIATQERGVHSSIMDEGGATGLMQVQNEVWENYNKISYNFEIGDYESYYITPEKIQDLEQNIKIGCTIFQECLQNMNYNIPAAIQCYNMGQGSMYQILNAYSLDTGKTIDEILNDPNDIGWLNYRYIIPYGDPNYVENVLSWMGESANITVLNSDGEEVSLMISNKTNEKKPAIC